MGHFDFLATLLEGLPLAKRTMARRVLERYELLSSPWSQVIGEMSKLGMSRKGLDELAALDLCGELQQRLGGSEAADNKDFWQRNCLMLKRGFSHYRQLQVSAWSELYMTFERYEPADFAALELC